jgi:hypothetical protein
MDKDLPGTRDVDDFMLVTTTADIEYAHGQGFNLRTIQGYVYAPCTPEPGCIPPSAQKFYRACNTSAIDCATFLESEAATFAANGYTTTFPPIGGTKTLSAMPIRRPTRMETDFPMASSTPSERALRTPTQTPMDSRTPTNTR